jgi:hypothetical protein
MFVACQSISVVVIRAVGSGGFFVFRLLLLVSSSWLVLFVLEMQVSHWVAHVQRIRCIRNSPLKHPIVYLT